MATPTHRKKWKELQAQLRELHDNGECPGVIVPVEFFDVSEGEPDPDIPLPLCPRCGKHHVAKEQGISFILVTRPKENRPNQVKEIES